MTAARLVAVTRPVDPEIPGPEGLVVYCARVSNPAGQGRHDTAAKLLAYLVRHQHWSPFEMVHAVVEIECPRDIARQILRHRSFSFQEFSQRYAKALGLIQREARRQDATNRQSSHADLPRWKRALWAASVAVLTRYVALVYAQGLRMGMAKETMRVVLPEGLTVSRLYMAGTLRSWLHYLEIREGVETQAEHREIARAIREALRPEFPAAMGAAA